jgi:hypothetical protein
LRLLGLGDPDPVTTPQWGCSIANLAASGVAWSEALSHVEKHAAGALGGLSNGSESDIDVQLPSSRHHAPSAIEISGAVFATLKSASTVANFCVVAAFREV